MSGIFVIFLTVHQLAGLDIVESPDRAETPCLWEEGAEPGPEYDDNQDLQNSCSRGIPQPNGFDALSSWSESHKDKKQKGEGV